MSGDPGIRSSLIVVATAVPTISIAGFLFARGWWIAGVLVVVLAVAAFVWARRYRINAEIDDVLQREASPEPRDPSGEDDRNA